MDWVEITELEKHWEESTVTASHEKGNALNIQTKGVNALVLTPPPAWSADGNWSLKCDGELLSARSSKIQLARENGHWKLGERGPKELHKRHGLQGPIDDAFQEPFVFVRPTGTANNKAVDQWVQSEMQRALDQWKLVFRGEIQIVPDTDVTPALMNTHHLVLWGDPGSNKLLTKLLSSADTKQTALPLKWNEKELRLGNRAYPSQSHAPVMIFPNPLAPGRYIVLNSTFTFRQGSDTTNALQTPKLPDWAIVDLSTPPDHLSPGRIQDAGFFDENWRLP
jgi:hypothetical protein